MRAQRLFCGKYYSQSRGDTLSKLMREEDNEKARTLSKTPAVTRWPQRRDRNFREKEGSPLEGTRFCQNRATKVSKGRRRTRLQVLQSPRTWGGSALRGWISKEGRKNARSSPLPLLWLPDKRTTSCSDKTSCVRLRRGQPRSPHLLRDSDEAEGRRARGGERADEPRTDCDPNPGPTPARAPCSTDRGRPGWDAPHVPDRRGGEGGGDEEAEKIPLGATYPLK